MNSVQITNPYNGKLLAEVPLTGREETFAMVEQLHKGLKTQADMAAYQRADILNKLAELLKRDRQKIAAQITAEMGKTITDSLIEVDRGMNTVIYSAEESRRITGDVIDADVFAPRRDKRGMTVPQPIGVVLAITPFNFPINLPLHKIAPAFAAGCTILYKPGPQNYLSAKLLTDLCWEAGMPKDCIQLALPDIATMGELVKHPKIACINFTGGTATAKAIAANSGWKKLLFELGGNDPLIVMPDADIELAVKTTVNQRFGTAGQRCTASKRILIHESVFAKFRDRIVEEAKKLKVGDPMEPSTFIGPVVNEASAKAIQARIEDAVKAGAKLLAGGKREGAIIWPTILEDVPLKCELVHDETFGPVAPLIKFKDIDEAISIVNSTAFGLQSGVFTNDLRTIKKLFRELEVGTLAVNDGPAFRAEHMPFGGVKDSGTGREGVAYAIREMTVIKTLVF